MIENIINGKTIHFTGQFELNPQYCAERLGATVVKSIAPDSKRLLGPVDFVVAGRSPSSISLEQAQNLGIKVLDEKGFFEFVNLQDVWEEHEKAKAAKQRDMKPEVEMKTLETHLGRPLTDEELALIYKPVTDRSLEESLSVLEIYAEAQAQDLNRRDIPSPLGGRWEVGDTMRLITRLSEFLKRQERMGRKWRTDPPILHPPADEEAEPITVWALYELSRYPELEDDLSFAIGQYSHESGSGAGYWENGWNCYTNEEVLQVSRIIEGFGLSVTVGDDSPAFDLVLDQLAGGTH
jgi:hypothetical protein